MAFFLRLLRGLAKITLWSQPVQNKVARMKHFVFLCFLSLSACSPATKDNVKTSPVPVHKGTFSDSDICKAALSSLSELPASEMRAGQADDGSVRVEFSRLAVNKHSSFKCKLSKDRVLTLDESLTGARWYGESSDLTQLSFKVVDDGLFIRITTGSSFRERLFDHHDLSAPIIDSKSNNGIEDIISHAKATSAKIGNFTFKKVDKINMPNVTYLVTFETGWAEMLTVPVNDGDENKFNRNIAITQRWKETYCTKELYRIMKSNGINMITGVITSKNGERHSSASCF